MVAPPPLGAGFGWFGWLRLLWLLLLLLLDDGFFALGAAAVAFDDDDADDGWYLDEAAAFDDLVFIVNDDDDGAAVGDLADDDGTVRLAVVVVAGVRAALVLVWFLATAADDDDGFLQSNFFFASVDCPTFCIARWPDARMMVRSGREERSDDVFRSSGGGQTPCSKERQPNRDTRECTTRRLCVCVLVCISMCFVSSARQREKFQLEFLFAHFAQATHTH